MPYTEAEINYIGSLSAPATGEMSVPEPQGENPLWRFAKHIPNLPANVVNSTLNSLKGLGNIVNQDDAWNVNSEPIQGMVDIAPAQTTSDKVVDFAGKTLAPEIATWLLGYGALGRAAGAAGLSRSVGLEAAKQGIVSGVQASKYGKEEALNAAVFGAVGGSLEKFGRIKRILPALIAATAEGASLKTFTDASDKEAAIMTAVSFLGSMAPGKLDAVERSLFANKPLRQNIPMDRRGPQMQEGQTQGELFRTVDPTGTPVRGAEYAPEPGRETTAIQGDLLDDYLPEVQRVQGEVDAGINNPSSEELARFYRGEEARGRIDAGFGIDQTPTSKTQSAYSIMFDGHEQREFGFDASNPPTRQAVPVGEPRQPFEPMSETRERLRQTEEGEVPLEQMTLGEGRAHAQNLREQEARATVDAMMGVDRSAPTDQRLLGTGYQDPPKTRVEGVPDLVPDQGQVEINFPLNHGPDYEAPYLPRKGEQYQAPFMRKQMKHAPKTPAEEAVESIGVRADDGQPSLFDYKPATSRDPNDYRPAIMTDKRVYEGAKGEEHKDIMGRHMGDADGDMLNNQVDETSRHGFIDSEGNFHSREATGLMLGYKGKMDSQALREMQKGLAETKPDATTPIAKAPASEPVSFTPVEREFSDVLNDSDLFSARDRNVLSKLQEKGETSVRNYLSDFRDRLNAKGDTDGGIEIDRMFEFLDSNPLKPAVIDDVAADMRVLNEIDRALDRTDGSATAHTQALASLARKWGVEVPKVDNMDEIVTSLVSAKVAKDSLGGGGMRKPTGNGHSGISGQISSELISGAGGAVLGGLTGYAEEDGSIAYGIGGAIAGAALGILGARAIENMRIKAGSLDPKSKIKLRVSPRPPEEKLSSTLARVAEQTFTDKAGRAVAGRGGVMAHAALSAQNMLGLGQSWAVKKAAILSKGLISDMIEKLQGTMKAALPFKPTDDFRASASKYLKGQMLSDVDSKAILERGKAIKSAEFEALPNAVKEHMYRGHTQKWIVRDADNLTNTNTKGAGLEVWKVTKETEQQLVKANMKALKDAAGNNGNNLEFMKLPLQARQAMNQLMGLVHDALPADSSAAKKILGTMDQHQTRTFEIFTNPKYYPSESKIKARMNELKEYYTDSAIKKYTRTDSADGYQPIEIGGEVRYIKPEDKDVLGLYSNETFLRKEVEEELANYKRNKKMLTSGESNDIDASQFKGRKELTPAVRAMMGEHHNVVDEIVHSINRLSTSAEAGSFIKQIIDGPLTSAGLKEHYGSPEDYLRRLNEVELAMKTAKDPAEFGRLQTQKNHLEAYRRVGADIKMGLLENSYLSPSVYKHLKDYRSPFGILENSIGRGFANFNNVVKQTRTLYNPITHVRNAIQIPMFLAMADAKDPEIWVTAAQILANKNHPLRSKIVRNGILDATQVRGEFNVNVNNLVNGDFDTSAWRKIHKTVGEIYNVSDAFVRVSAFLSAEKRAAKEFNLPLNDPKVQDAALKFTERRTMNYSNVPDSVKVARQLPFINMYISYAHEIARISGNMAVDTAHGDWRAGATLGALVAAPFVMQQTFEAGLSEEDRKAWRKTNEQAPDYSRSRFKLPVSRDKNGNFKYYDMTALVPHDNYLQVAEAISKGDAAGAFAVNPVFGWENTPILSILSEQITGRDNRTRRDFRGAWDQLSAIVEEMSPSEMPGFGYENKKLVQSLSLNDKGGRGITNQKTGRSENFGNWLIRHGSGLNPSSVNPDIVARNTQRRFQHEIANEKAYLNDVLKSDAAPEAKQKAIEVFKQAAMLHLQEYRNLVDADAPQPES